MYLYEPSVARAVQPFAGDPRITVTVRHPASLMFSMDRLRLRHALHTGYPPPPTFEAALEEDANRSGGPDRRHERLARALPLGRNLPPWYADQPACATRGDR